MNTLEDRLRRLDILPASPNLRRRLAALSPSGGKRPGVLRLIPLSAAAAAFFIILVMTLLHQSPISLPAQETPEETFRKIEETATRSNTLQVVFKREATLLLPEGKEQKVETKGSLYVRGDNRLLVDYTESFPADPKLPAVQWAIISNGTRLQNWLVHPGGLKSTVPERDVPKDLYLRFALGYARQSIATPGNLVAIPMDDLKKGMLEVTQIQAGPDDGKAKTLLYQVGPWKAKIWYSPKVYLIEKRTLENKQLGSWTETYSEVTTGAQITDDHFQLRTEK
jgi:hypothetical protein